MSTRGKGLIASGIVLVIVVALLAFSASRQSPTSTPDRAAITTAPPDKAPPAADVITAVGGKMTAQDVLSGGEHGQWTRTRADGTIESRILSQSIDPLPDGRFVVNGLEMWLYSESSSIRVKAPRAELIWPRQDQEPESGDLTGGVEIAMFDEQRSTLPADAPLGEPTLVASLPSAHLESALSQIESRDIVNVSVPDIGATFRGKGLTLRVSELRQSLQLLRVEADPDNKLTFSPAAAAEKESKSPTKQAGKSSDPSASNGTATAPNDKPKQIDPYRMMMNGPIRITQGERVLTADQLVVWAKLYDGALRPQAVRSITFADSSKSVGKATNTGAAGKQSKTESSDDIDWSKPVEMTWGGTLEIRLAQDEPPELARDDVFARLESTPESPTKLVLPDLNVQLTSSRIEYGATSARFAISGSSGRPVVLTSPQVRLDQVERAEFFLADAPLVRGVITGPGSIAIEQPDDGPDHTGVAAWNGQAEFAAMWNDGSLVPESAHVTGTVATASSQGAAKAESLTAKFDAGKVQSIKLEGNAEATSAEGEVARAQMLEASFIEGANDRRLLDRVAAEGNVTAMSTSGELRSADRVAMNFVTQGKERGRVSRFEASGHVSARTIDADNSVEVHGEQITGDAIQKVLDVTGSPAMIANITQTERAGVIGGSLHIEGERRLFWAYGPVSTSLARIDKSRKDDWHFQAQSSDGLMYNGLLGHAELRGDVLATGEQKNERHTLRGDRLTVTFDSSNPDKIGKPIEATLEGEDFTPGSSNHAQAETRLYKKDELGSGINRKLAALLSLEGRTQTVLFDSRTIDQPGPGRLVIEERRSAKDKVKNASSEDDDAPKHSRDDKKREPEFVATGTTVFTWQGGLRANGDEGHATMREKVRVRHLPHDADAKLLELECELVTADFTITDPANSDSASKAVTGELRKVVASGATFVRIGDVEAVCDRVEFDAATNEAIAFAHEGNRMTVVDHARGGTFSAEVISIDVRTGYWKRIERGSVMMTR